MIRAEILLEVDNFLDNENDFNNIKKLINKIYDDFENKICKNCKWFNKVGLVGYSCSNKKNKEMFGMSIIWINENFGCNKFERKEK